MRRSCKQLFECTAEDLMTRDVIALPQAMSLQEAAHRLSEAGVSGAPVMDDAGRCVGVLSRGDLIRAVEEGLPRPPEPPFFGDWQIEEEGDGPGEVARMMTRSLIAVPPDASLAEIARAMHSSRVHRVLVQDEAGRVVGVVSSLDVLGALAEEAATQNNFAGA